MKTPRNDTGAFPRPALDGSFPVPDDGGCYASIGPAGQVRIPIPGMPKRMKPIIPPFFPIYRP